MEKEKWLRAISFSSQGDYEAAVLNFEDLLGRVSPQANKTRAQLFFNLALLDAAMGYIQRAIEKMTRAIQNYPSLPIFFFQRGVFYHLHEDYREAIIDYSETLRMFSKDESAMTFRDDNLSFSLSRHEIVFNRALALSATGLNHRARDDLIYLLESVQSEEQKASAQALLTEVQNRLSKLPLSALIQ